MSLRNELDDITKIKIYYPQTIDEVKKIINYARDNNLTVRTLGSGHSPSNSIYAVGQQMQIKLAGDLKEISQFKINEAKDSALVTVGAGCNLGVDPSDPKSKLENSLNYQIDQKGFALPILGGISHQTVAGFLSTSSSGGSTKYSMADAIEEIGFVDGMGVYRRVSAKGDEKDIFYAVGVSMGLLGVITDVTFKLVPRYFVAGEEINQEMKTSYPTLDKTLFNNNEFIHINWFAQKYLNRITLWHGKSVSTDEKITPYNHVLSSKVMALAASDVLYTTNILNETSGDSDRTQEVIATFLKPFVLLNQKQNFCDTWYKALPIDDQANVDGLMNTSFSEIWFPRDQFDNVMQTTNALFAKHPKAAGNLIVELYCAKESPFWLSPAYGQDALRMDLYWWNHNSKGDANNYFGQFYEAFKTIPGTRFHWGKHLPHPGEKYGEYTFMPEHLQKNYPKLGEFLQLREKLDPQQIFVTDYWRNMLSIPKPVPQVKPWRIYETGKYVFGMFYKEQVPAIPCEEKTALQKLFK